VSAHGDPVLQRRARIARAVSAAKRVGYLLLLGSVILFAVAAATGFPDGVVTATIVMLVAACIVLPVPIVLGYGLRAAEREDRERGLGPHPDPSSGGGPQGDQR
jgi:hypothetical protein